MSDSNVFDLVCDELEQRTPLSRLEARGTVRLALKEAGLDPANVTVPQMTVVVQKVLPRELETRRVADAPGVCTALVQRLAGAKVVSGAGDTPEAVFARLGGH
jgi:hypothetical protein